MFELALGAEWTLCGGHVELLEPDLLLRTSGRNYLVACKRPEYEHGIRASVRSAAGQLRSALSAAPENYYGIIAASLSQVVNRGNAYFSGDYDQLSRLLNGMMATHRHSWRTTDFHPRNIAVAFYAHTPADWGSGLFRLNAVLCGPALGEKLAYRDLIKDIEALYSNGPTLSA